MDKDRNVPFKARMCTRSATWLKMLLQAEEAQSKPAAMLPPPPAPAAAVVAPTIPPEEPASDEDEEEEEEAEEEEETDGEGINDLPASDGEHWHHKFACCDECYNGGKPLLWSLCSHACRTKNTTAVSSSATRTYPTPAAKR